ncbi:MAG: CDF family Co(II)/Ni(II) efflux transporter DmeF [Pseudomonadota bacterium]
MSQPDCPQSWLGEHHDRNERRTRWVVVLTCVMMVAEIAGGSWYGSMAVVADGWHMATHAAALGVAMFAYRYARRHADNPRFAFGTGKVGDLAGFASAVTLFIVGVLIGADSLQRLFEPVQINFSQAGGIAAVGLVVNLVSAWMLRDDHGHKHEDDHPHDHGHAHEHAAHAHSHAGHEDTNLRAAYVHILADALTSVLAIVALLAGRFLGWVWMDAAIGLLGAVVIAHWSVGLARSAGRTLLDSHDDSSLEKSVRERLRATASGATVTDLHLWRLGAGRYALMVSLRGANLGTPDSFRTLLADLPQLAHVTVEVNPA